MFCKDHENPAHQDMGYVTAYGRNIVVDEVRMGKEGTPR